MASKRLQAEVDAVDSLGHAAPGPDVTEALRRALTHRNNYLVSRAARAVQQLSLADLTGALLQAAGRFFEGGAETDPQCWAKIALLQALSSLGYDEPELYLRGLRCVQMEPVRLGRVDTAAPLRAQCAHALIDSRQISDPELLRHLVETLFDPEPRVRTEAARAVGRLARAESALLLRARCLAADPEPEPFGAALTALLELEGEAALDFAERFLHEQPHVCWEAAHAISTLRTERACDTLLLRLGRIGETDFRETLLTALALMRMARGDACLRELAAGPGPDARLARRAWKSAGRPEADLAASEKG
jgi:hypothetical protein